MAQKIKQFFAEFEAIWEAFPSYVKVFIYSVTSSVFGLWVSGQLEWKAVIIILAINLGIYQAPRTINKGVQRLK